MFTKALIAICILTACSFGADGECSNEYYTACGSDDECCSPMQCWNGGDPYHCQVSCIWDWECKTKDLKEKFGDMHCLQTDIFGFCRQTGNDQEVT